MSGTVAVVLCAGQGTRMGAGMNKIFLPARGKPILAHTLGAFQRAARVDEVVLVAHPDEGDLCREVVSEWNIERVSAIIPGGASRHQSERNALDHLRGRIAADEVITVLIHDGARPLLPEADINALLDALAGAPGAILIEAVPRGALLSLDDGLLAPLSTDDTLGRAHTPQAFKASVLLDAYDRAQLDGFEGTDTAASLERLGFAVAAVISSGPNLKVTTPDDLVRAEVLLGE